MRKILNLEISSNVLTCATNDVPANMCQGSLYHLINDGTT